MDNSGSSRLKENLDESQISAGCDVPGNGAFRSAQRSAVFTTAATAAALLADSGVGRYTNPASTASRPCSRARDPAASASLFVPHAFVAKLSPSGNSLVYFKTFGGSSYDGANSIAIDSSGSVIVAGGTGLLTSP